MLNDHKNENDKDEKKEVSDNSTNILQLRYNNPEGDSTIGFRYSKYKDSESSKDTPESELINSSNKVNGGICKQIGLMTWKNYLVFSRNIKPTMFQLLTPVAICFILLMLQSLVNNFSDGLINKNPELIPLYNINKCVYPDDCTTIGYGIISVQKNKTYKDIDKIMQYVAESNNLNFTNDVKLHTIGDSNSFLNFLKIHQNKTRYGVLFCIDNMDFLDLSIPCSFEYLNYTFHLYTVLYNVTLAPNGFLTSPGLPHPKDPELAKLKQDIDNAYLKFYSLERGLNFIPKINATMQSFPTSSNRFLEKADVVSSEGAFYFFFPPMITFVVVLLEIIREKDLKLRKSLLIIGLNNWAFWISWFITSVIFSFLISFILVLSGCICNFGVFVNTPFLISLMLFFLFTLTMQFVAYFLTTILKSMNSAYTVSYAFILIGLVMEIFLSNYAIIYFLYSTELPWWVDIIKFVFELYPPFNFSKAFSDIANKAANHFDNNEWRWVQGPGYKWSDLFQRIKGTMRPNIQYDVPSTAETMGKFFLDIVLFALLTYYFDHVDSSNRGKTYSKLFCLEPSYWGCSKKKKMHRTEKDDELINQLNSVLNQSEQKLLDKDDHLKSSNKLSSDYNSCNYTSNNPSLASFDLQEDSSEVGLKSVIEEKLKILRSEQEGSVFDGLRILGCSKTYTIANKCCGTREVKALKDTYLEIPMGELFTILGHNGAGKSTLINILTGNISPTSGTATIEANDIISDPLAIEELIGLCPQHDILWEELTAKEHIELYANLRDYPKREISNLIIQKLREVNLTSKGNSEVRTFSGGMKRRLSILLSTIGQPKVIFLDEPTTGLDPVNKRFIWSMIQKMKKNKAVILTTHSMEEADFLSDRIGVIVEGRFKCIGTSLELKRIFGGGYLITFVCDRDNIDTVKLHIKKIMPSSIFIDSSGGSIILNLPFKNANEMKYFISILNNRYNDKDLKPLEGLIKECGMDFTTLEEIFLKITSKKNRLFNNKLISN